MGRDDGRSSDLGHFREGEESSWGAGVMGGAHREDPSDQLRPALRPDPGRHQRVHPRCAPWMRLAI